STKASPCASTAAVDASQSRQQGTTRETSPMTTLLFNYNKPSGLLHAPVVNHLVTCCLDADELTVPHLVEAKGDDAHNLTLLQRHAPEGILPVGNTFKARRNFHRHRGFV